MLIQPGAIYLTDLAFNGSTGNEEDTFQVEGQSNYSNGYPDQAFYTTCFTYNSSDGSLVSYRIMGSSGGIMPMEIIKEEK